MDWTLEVVAVPVADMDRAKRFYSEQVGFVVDYDTRVADEIRNVQLAERSVQVSDVYSSSAHKPRSWPVIMLGLVRDRMRPGVAGRGTRQLG
jgi:catechol 2,3-dioxygenase-like lactoylglutathione lyase family enzyme